MAKKTVLIIENDNMLSEILRIAVESVGAEANCCNSGSEAVDILKDKQYDVMIVDYQVPDFTGADVIKVTRFWIPKTLIIGMSIASKEKDFLEAGANVFLQKPFDLGKMLSLIEKHFPAL